MYGDTNRTYTTYMYDLCVILLIKLLQPPNQFILINKEYDINNRFYYSHFSHSYEFGRFDTLKPKPLHETYINFC